VIDSSHTTAAGTIADPNPQELKKIEGGDADRLLRDQAQAKCIPIWIDRREVVSAQETLGGLGLELRRSAGAGDLPASRA
jgi:hypothetical protein